MYTEGGCAACISAATAAVISLGVIYAVSELYVRSNAADITDAAEKACGAFGRYAVSVFVLAYCAVAFVFALREFTGIVKMLAFPTAPEWFVSAFFMLAVMLASARGRNAVIRAHALIVPISLCVTVMMFAAVLRNCRLDNLFPILGNGTARIFGGAFKGLAMYSDVILIFLTNPFGAAKKELIRSTKGAVIAAAAVNVVFMLIYASMVYIPMSVGIEYPVYRIFKEVDYGRFFRRTDSLYMLTAALCGMLYLSFLCGTFADTVENVFAAEGRVFAAPLFIALYIVSLCATLWKESRVNADIIFFGCAVPIVLIAVAAGAFLRKGGRGNEKA